MLLNKKIIGLSCLIGLAIAGLFFAIQQELIIFNWHSSQIPTSSDDRSFRKQSVKLYFWKNQRWEFEKIDILWGTSAAQNLTNLTQAWLNQLEEESLIKHKITLQSAILSINGQTAYLSFDQTLFRKQHSTGQKLYLIESLLKTWRENGIKVSQVQLLLRHQTYQDPHLDLSLPWPTTGFTT